MLHDWEDPAVLHRNREPAHVPLAGYADAAAALAKRTSNIHSLDGQWRFFLAAKPDQAPPGFEHTDFDDRAWSSIPVPSTW